METTTGQQPQPGDVVKAIPLGGTRRVTVKVATYRDGIILGRRAKVNEDGSTATRGELHTYYPA